MAAGRVQCRFNCFIWRCQGEIGQLILNDKAEEASEVALKWQQKFGDRFYLELQRYAEGKAYDDQERYIQHALHSSFRK